MKGFNSIGSDAVVRRGGRMTPSGKAATAALLTLTMAISGCSHSRQKATNSNQNSSTQTQSSQLVAPAVPATVANQLEVPKTKSVKGPVKRLPATRTYKDQTAGLSFTYPRRSRLEVGDKAEQDAVAATELPMNFVQPGGVTMAVVELPGLSKSGSDFTPAFFAISVNKGLSADQCEQFAGMDNSDKPNSDSEEKAAVSMPTSKLSIGGVDYVEVDKTTEHGTAKYYHRFISGATPDDNACYEFAMSVKSAEQKDGIDARNSDLEHKDAFIRLEKILASVSIRSEKKSEVVEAAKMGSVSSEPAKTAEVKSETEKTEASTGDAAKTAAKMDENPR